MSLPPEGRGGGFDGSPRPNPYTRIVTGITSSPTRVNSDAVGVPVMCTALFPDAVTIQVADHFHLRLPLVGKLNAHTIKYASSLIDGWIPLAAYPEALIEDVARSFDAIAQHGITFREDLTREWMIMDVPDSLHIRRVAALDDLAMHNSRDEMRRRMGRIGAHHRIGRITSNSFYAEIMRGINRSFGLF